MEDWKARSTQVIPPINGWFLWIRAKATKQRTGRFSFVFREFMVTRNQANRKSIIEAGRIPHADNPKRWLRLDICRLTAIKGYGCAVHGLLTAALYRRFCAMEMARTITSMLYIFRSAKWGWLWEVIYLCGPAEVQKTEWLPPNAKL